MKKLVLMIGAALALGACERAADVASRNLSNAADEFQINRRIVFVNTWTGEYVLEVRSLCSLGNRDSAGQLTVTCKLPTGDYVKHFLGLSNSMTYFVEQIDPKMVSTAQYTVNFKPTVIVPILEFNK